MKKILIIILLAVPQIGLAAGVQVSPDKLEFTTNSQQSKEMVVANPTADVQIFEIYPDDFERAISIKPESFTLEAGGRKKVEVSVDASRLSASLITTNLSILARPLADSKLKVNTGIKIPLTVAVAEQRFQKYILPLIALIIVIISFLAYWYIKKRKRLLNSK